MRIRAVLVFDVAPGGLHRAEVIDCIREEFDLSFTDFRFLTIEDEDIPVRAFEVESIEEIGG